MESFGLFGKLWKGMSYKLAPARNEFLTPIKMKLMNKHLLARTLKYSLMFVLGFSFITYNILVKVERDFEGKVYERIIHNPFTKVSKGKLYDENGAIDEIYSIKNDKAHGKNINYHKYSNLIYEKIEYKNGRIWNVLEYNDLNGNKLDYGFLKDGNGEVCTYNEEGKLRSCGHIINGYKDGKWAIYIKENEFSHYTEYKNGYGVKTKLFINYW